MIINPSQKGKDRIKKINKKRNLENSQNFNFLLVHGITENKTKLFHKIKLY